MSTTIHSQSKPLGEISNSTQEVRGVRHLSSNRLRHVVVAEHWPSIAFSLAASLSQHIGVVVSSASMSSFVNTILSEHEGVVPGLEFCIEYGSEELTSLKPDVLWIQGSESFITTTLESFDPRDETQIISINPPVGRKGKGVSITHAKVGGVSSSRWQVQHSEGLHDRSSLTSFTQYVPRTLEHVYSSTVNAGFQVGPSALARRSAGKERVFRAGDRVPVGQRNISVVAPCVFKQSGYTQRSLVVKELLEVFDVPIHLQSLITKFEDAEELLKSIVTSVPGKIAMHVVRVTLEQINNPEGEDDNILTHELHEQSEDCLLGGHIDYADPKMVEWLHFDASDVNDETAARSDDLGADVAQWDSYVVQHFDPKSEVEDMEEVGIIPKGKSGCWKGCGPLICKGKEVTNQHTTLFNLLRTQLLRICKRNLVRSFVRHLEAEYGKDWYTTESDQLELDLEVGRDAITRFGKSTWWDWSGGSTLHFWRWHKQAMGIARDGIPMRRTNKLSPYLQKQRWPKSPTEKEQMIQKLRKVMERGYIRPGKVKSLTGFFPVPKGKEDIRMVYDATKCGLNATLWAPSFWLPTIDNTLAQVEVGGFMADIDLGEMFLNFPLDRRLWAEVGVDVSEIEEEVKEVTGHELAKGERMHWTRCLMGLRSSPFHAVQTFAWAEEFIRGLPREDGNAFAYERVQTNYPGAGDYDPGLPRVYKQRLINGSWEFASNFEIYIDDIRVCGSTLRECTKAARRIAARSNYLGIQDAPRKRRFPARNPGAWSGAIVISTDNALFTSTTQKKWDKGKNYVNSWLKQLEEGDHMLDRKELERGRGFLVHLSRTYPIMVANLKGLHHVLESWRIGRDRDGWKWSASQWRQFLEDAGEIGEEKADWQAGRKRWNSKRNRKAPKLVDGNKVKRFIADLKELDLLFRHPRPPRRLVRGKGILMVQYGFGDASGSGFGATWESKDGVKFRFGVWGSDNAGRSSNYRELRNLVETIETMGKEGELTGIEMYFFTDNSTAEKAYYKGSSTSEALHELVGRLKRVQMSYGCNIILTHVAGTRMIQQGADGLSRGNLTEGVMAGKEMKEFIPLHLSALERCNSLLPWIKGWAEDRDKPLEVLQVEDWYGRGHDVSPEEAINVDGIRMTSYKPGTLLWHPAPAGALVAIEQLRKARTKRTNSTHIVVCPKLLEPEWKSQLWKAADLICEIPVGQSYWPSDMHETLTLAICFPYLTHRPWELKKAPVILDVGKHLRRMWKEDSKSQGALLRELLRKTTRLKDMSPQLVLRMLRSVKQFGLPH